MVTESVMLGPESNEYGWITISKQNYFSPWGQTLSDLAVSLSISGPQSQVGYMTIDLETFGFTDYTAAANNMGTVQVQPATGSAPLDQATVLRWMKSASADVTEPVAIAEADALLAALGAIPEAGMPGEVDGFLATNSSYAYPVPAVWFILLKPVLWFFVWVTGLVLFVRNRRSRLRPTAGPLDGAV